MSTPLPHRCEDCHRPVVRGPVLWDAGTPYGPRCGRARGLDGGRRVRARRPERTGVEQPVLFDLDEINDESEEAMDYEPDPDDLTRAELAELAHLPYYAAAETLDEWLSRAHGVISSSHNAGLFLDLLAARGWEVVRKEQIDPADLLPAPSE